MTNRNVTFVATVTALRPFACVNNCFFLEKHELNCPPEIKRPNNGGTFIILRIIYCEDGSARFELGKNPQNKRQVLHGLCRNDWGYGLMIKKIAALKEGVVGRYQSRIREKAITQAKARIALSERDIKDFSESDLEVIVQDEEQKVKGSLKQSAVVAALIVLGLS